MHKNYHKSWRPLIYHEHKNRIHQLKMLIQDKRALQLKIKIIMTQTKGETSCWLSFMF
jgi:hypothetical protein